VVQKTVLVGRGLWVTCYGGLEVWPSITWTVLSGSDAVLVDQWLWGNLEPEEMKCTKWTLMY